VKRVEVEKQQVIMPIDAFYFAIHTMIDRANAPFRFDLPRDPVIYGVALLPFRVYKKMEEFQNVKDCSC